MGDIRNKMNLKQQQLAIVQLPAELERSFSGEGSWTNYGEVPELPQEAYLVFVKDKESLEDQVVKILEQATDKSQIWFSYPKKSSKRYKSEISRVKDWELMELGGYEPVKQISLSEDWTALQFRKGSM